MTGNSLPSQYSLLATVAGKCSEGSHTVQECCRTRKRRQGGNDQVLPNPQVRQEEEMCLVALGVLWGYEANLR